MAPRIQARFCINIKKLQKRAFLLPMKVAMLILRKMSCC
ncbi:MAG: Hypothetical protein AJITA_00584 [Acetilactobacillus jinshanensis]